MPRRVLVAVLLVVCAVPAFAGKRARALQCRQECGPAIQLCVAGGQRARKCKRQTLRRCRREGITVCVPPQTYDVAPTGGDGPACGTADAPCRTIQYVIDQLVPAGGAGTVKVAAGTFADLASCLADIIPNQAVVCVVNKQITLVGGFIPPNWDLQTADPSLTVIDGSGQGRGVRFAHTRPDEAAATLEMDGFTIRNGLAQGTSSADPSVAAAFGGGMLAENGTFTLRNVVFHSNQALGATTDQAEGGRGAGGGLAAMSTESSGTTGAATLQNVTFDANEAHGGDGLQQGGYALGGALFTYLFTVSGDTLVFTNNTASAGSTNGSGVSGTDKSDALGGAVSVERDGAVTLQHVGASGNMAIGGDAPNGEAGSAFGGAFFVEQGSLTLSQAVVAHNQAHGGNGKNTTTASSIAQGGGIYTTMGTLTIERTIVLGNETHSGDGVVNGGVSEGGGLAVTMGSNGGVDTPFAITNSVIANNLVSIGSGTRVGGGGGGLFVQGATGTIDYSTLANNRLGDPRLLGGGLTVFPLAGFSTLATLTNGIVADHTTPGLNPSCYATAALWVAQNATASVNRVLFANNVHDTNAGTGGGCNVTGGTVNLSGALSAPDAGFVSPGTPDDDYHLVAGSPAIDQAIGGSNPIDLDGDLRPYGVAPDLGAYEFTP